MWLYLQNSKVNLYDFLAQNTFDHKQKEGKKNFSKFSSIFEKQPTLQKLKKILKIFFCPSFVYGQRCFEPKNHKDWPYRFGDIATIPSKTWFFTNFTFLAFLTHPNDQKMFWRARSQFFHVLKHQIFFCLNLGSLGTLGPKVFGPAWIQSTDVIGLCLISKIFYCLKQ